MKNEMRLQGIGMVEGTEAGKIQVGDILRWNHGGLSKVISFELSKTGKTINCKVEVVNSRTGEKEIYERSMRVTRLVNIVASANTNNDFNLQFDPIKEEAPEAEAPEAEEVKDFKRYSELLEKVYGMKTTATEEEQEELERLGYKLKLNGVPDAISEMNLYRLQNLVEEAPEAEDKIVEELKIVFSAYESKKWAERRKKEVEHVVNQIEEADDLKQSIHEVTYRITNHGSYVEVMLFVTDVANDVTLVAQQEGEYDSMAEAEALINYLKKTGNKIEFVETVAYIG